MVGMIVDYRENGVDKHGEFIAPYTDDHERAVYALADAMEKRGQSVSCIVVCPDAKNFEDLRRMAETGFEPDKVYLPYVFDERAIYGA